MVPFMNGRLDMTIPLPWKLRLWAVGLAIGLTMVPVSPVFAQRNRPDGNKPPQEWAGELRQINNWPLILTDSTGLNWNFQSGGEMYNDNENILSHANRLTVNGQHLQPQQMWASADGNSVVTSPMRVANNLQVTRLMTVLKGTNCLRVLEVLENTTDKPFEVSVALNHNSNYSIENVSGNAEGFTADSRTPQKLIVESNQGRHVAGFLTAGSGAKCFASVRANRNNNEIRISYQGIAIPPSGRAVLMHVIARKRGEDKLQDLLMVSERELLRSVPSDLRKNLVNFRRQIWSLDDLEVLRGDNDDVVVLTGGQQLHGQLQTGELLLRTGLGEFTVSLDRVAGLIPQADGQVRLVLLDGQVLLGMPAIPQVAFQLTTGQTLQLPFAKIRQLGTKSAGQDPETWFQPLAGVRLRTGERLAGRLQRGELTLVSRHGTFKLPAALLAGVECPPDQPVQRVELRGGSVLCGVLATDVFPMQLELMGAKEIPLVDIISLRNKPADAGSQPATRPAVPFAAPAGYVVQTAGAERLCGPISPGKLTLLTDIGPIEVELAHCKQIDFPASEPVGSARISLWDGSQTQGRVKEDSLQVAVGKGVTVNVKMGLVSRVVNSIPVLPPTMVTQVQRLIAQLDDADSQKRDEAQERLVEMGKLIEPLLREKLQTAKPEAKMRLEAVLQRLGVGSKTEDQRRPADDDEAVGGHRHPNAVPGMPMPMNCVIVD